MSWLPRCNLPRAASVVVVALSLLAALLGSQSASAQLFLEPYLAQGTDALGAHLFLINPASYHPKALDINLVSSRIQAHNSYEENNGAGNMTKITTESAASIMAVALVTDFGGGLAAGLTHQQFTFEDKSQSQNRGRTDYLETIVAKYSSGKAVVTIADGLTFGFLLRFLEAEIDLVGSFQANPRDRTLFKTSLFGTGGGIDYSPNKAIHIAAAFLPAMKGKTEIYSEEKIITEPGVVELSVANDAKPFRYGLAVRRMLYKRDDRVDGTTLNNANETAVNLLGLNAERARIFAREELQIGMGYEFSAQSLLNISLSQHKAEFIADPRTDLPGANSNNETYDYYMAKAFFNLTNKNLQFFAGFSKAFKSTSFTRNRNTKVSFEGEAQNFTLGLGAHL